MNSYKRFNNFDYSNNHNRNSYFSYKPNSSYYNNNIISYNKPYNNYYYNNNSLSQSQSLPRKHQRYNSVEQTNDLKNIVRILGNAMSYAENYAAMNGYNKPKKEFNYYDYYNASKNTEKNLYFKKFNASIQNVDNVFEYYTKKYNDQPFPPSLPKSQIIRRLNEYKQNVNYNDRRAYDNFIKVFE